MPISLNPPNSTFKLKTGLKNVYISSLIDINEDDTGIIKKPFLDYKDMRPMKIEKNFDNGVHRFNIHRYTKYEFFNKDELVFISLDKWEDPYETLFYKGNDSKNGLNIKIACMCCTYERVEGEEASWKRSMCEGKVNAIRISYNFNAFCNVLEQIAKDNNVRFYITVADYSNSIEQLKTASKSIAFTSEKKYISYLTLKRKAFAYENELRIFIVGKHLSFDNGVVKVRLLREINNLYDSITLPPMQPMSRENVKFEFYSELQFLQNLALRKQLEESFPSSSIHQCHLYELGESTLEKRYKKGIKNP